jgi:MSHA pilin protein MshA
MQRLTAKVRDQRGFTLIEIIMVIVLLGIIAAIAIPKYVDLRTEAADATASGIVGAIVSSASIGYADLVTHNSDTTFPAFAGPPLLVDKVMPLPTPQVLAMPLGVLILKETVLRICFHPCKESSGVEA